MQMLLQTQTEMAEIEADDPQVCNQANIKMKIVRKANM